MFYYFYFYFFIFSVWLLVSHLQGNIANVISTVQANKVTEDGSQAAQGLVARWGRFCLKYLDLIKFEFLNFKSYREVCKFCYSSIYFSRKVTLNCITIFDWSHFDWSFSINVALTASEGCLHCFLCLLSDVFIKIIKSWKIVFIIFHRRLKIEKESEAMTFFILLLYLKIY